MLTLQRSSTVGKLISARRRSRSPTPRYAPAQAGKLRLSVLLHHRLVLDVLSFARMVGLLVFSGSQAPLPVRYPHPAKPKLALPPLVHRSLHTALDAQPPSALFQDNLLSIPQPGTLVKHAPESDHEVTVKIQVDNGSPNALAAITEALDTLAQHKGLSTIDTALVGLPSQTSGELGRRKGLKRC